MIAYLDTHIAAWLSLGRTKKLSSKASMAVNRYTLRISPMAFLELEYMYELQRLRMPAVDAAAKLQAELGVEVCDYPFKKIAYAALSESWTRDAFDRVIVAHAKANGLAPLITADTTILEHYPQAVW